MDQQSKAAAVALYRQGNYGGAMTLLRDCGADADMLILRGICLAEQKKFAEAVRDLDLAEKLTPDNPEVYFNRGLVNEHSRNVSSAIADYREVMRLVPGHTGAANNLANLYKAAGLLSEAENVCRAALSRAPDSTEIMMALANVLGDQGCPADGLEYYRRALSIDPFAFTVRSNLLLHLNYLETSPEELFREHRLWNRYFMEKNPSPSYTAPPAAGERLRVGYVSPDFRYHSVAFFFEPVLSAHDRARFEIHGFADVGCPDAVTRRQAELFDCWHDISAMNAEDATAYIRQCGIDILVDLAGHTGRKLEIFARRSAPLQFTWLGYPNTTGLRNMDCRLTDELADPPGSERLFSEKLCYLPGGMWAYAPPADAPEIQPPPCLKNGYITFGSFNNIAKISESTVVLWSAVMNVCPGSRLILKNKALGDSAVRRRLEERFGKYGVGSDRLLTRGFEPEPMAHLAAYQDIDIALDTVPYNGTTTTFEALWMGVPVLSMVGNTPASRVGTAILKRLGLDCLSFADSTGMETAAAAYAAEPELLSGLRKNMRRIMAGSTLLDGARLAREMESIFMRRAVRSGQE